MKMQVGPAFFASSQRFINLYSGFERSNVAKSVDPSCDGRGSCVVSFNQSCNDI